MISTNTFKPQITLNTPVLFFFFFRLSTAKIVFESIRLAKPPRLYIASDGPRVGKEEELNVIKSVREFILNGIDWECDVKTLFREENLGCKYAVSSAISWFFDNEQQGIILEDDCLPTQSFFWYCEELLERYKNDKKIWHISGNNFQENNVLKDSSYYFSKHNHIWGWATWADRWANYDVEMKTYNHLNLDQAFKNIFDDNDEKLYWSNIFNKTSKGMINTWDYQWTYAVWSHGGLTAAPNVNLVSNIGFGEDATHTRDLESEHANMPVLDLKIPLTHPILIKRNMDADNYTTKKMFSRSHILSRLIKRFYIEVKLFINKIKS